MEIEVPITISMGHIKLPVSIDGQGPFSFVLDTGASVTTVAKNIADKLGIETRTGSKKEARGVGGGIPLQYADVAISIGDLVFEKDEVYVLDFDALFRGLGSRDGALGFTTLNQCTLTLNYSTESVKLAKGTSQRDLDWIPFEYVNDSHLFGFPVSINGQGPYVFVLDTGAGSTVMTPDFANQLDLDVQKVQGIARGLGGDVQLQMTSIDSLSIGTVELPNMQIAVIDSSGVSPKGKLIENGVIGYNFLMNFETVIDYPGKRIAFIPIQRS